MNQQINLAPNALAGKKPVINLNQEIGDFLKEEKVLRTAKLVTGWYVLSQDDVTVLIDTVRPRVYGVYTHGRLGTFQNLSYNTDSNELRDGLWGIVPVFSVGNERFYPFVHDYAGNAVEQLRKFVNEPGKVIFNAKKNRVELRNIRFFIENREYGNSVDGINMVIELKDRKLKVSVDYPPSAWKTELISYWYPLYTHFGTDDYRGRLLYLQQFETVTGGAVRLWDDMGRLPGLCVKSLRQRHRIVAVADKKNADAYKLEVHTEGVTQHDEVVYEFEPNPVTLKVNPMVNAGCDQSVAVLSKERPRIKIDGREIEAHTSKAGEYQAKINLEPGKHSITAMTEGGKDIREIYAVGNPINALVKTADALLKMQWKTPELKGLFPNKYWMDDLSPCWEGTLVDNPASAGWVFAAALAYSPRLIPNLVDAALITNDKKYMIAAWDYIEGFVKKCHQFEDGSLYPPTDSTQGGVPVPKFTTVARPRYVWEMVRGLLYAMEGYRYFGNQEKAKQCLEYGYRFALVLVKMQDKKGRLYEMYEFPSLKVTYPDRAGGVESGLMVIARLADHLEKVFPEEAKELRKMLSKAFDYVMSVDFLKTFSGEGSMHTIGVWHAISGLCLMRYLLNKKDVIYKKYAMDGFKVSIFMSQLYPYDPSGYLAPDSGGGPWFADKGGFPRLIARGDVMDMGSTEHGLWIKEYLGCQLGELVANYQLASRLASMICENGAVCGLEIHVPNYDYCKTDHSWENNHAGIGLNGFYYLTGRTIFKDK